MPMQLGPMMRQPADRATRTISLCSSSPLLPASAKPEVVITIVFTPLAAHSLTACRAESVGVRIMAKSTGYGMSSTVGYDFTPMISFSPGLTA